MSQYCCQGNAVRTNQYIMQLWLPLHMGDGFFLTLMRRSLTLTVSYCQLLNATRLDFKRTQTLKFHLFTSSQSRNSALSCTQRFAAWLFMGWHCELTKKDLPKFYRGNLSPVWWKVASNKVWNKLTVTVCPRVYLFLTKAEKYLSLQWNLVTF